MKSINKISMQLPVNKAIKQLEQLRDIAKKEGDNTLYESYDQEAHNLRNWTFMGLNWVDLPLGDTM